MREVTARVPLFPRPLRATEVHSPPEASCTQKNIILEKPLPEPSVEQTEGVDALSSCSLKACRRTERKIERAKIHSEESRFSAQQAPPAWPGKKGADHRWACRYIQRRSSRKGSGSSRELVTLSL